jgi:hypothetical protein
MSDCRLPQTDGPPANAAQPTGIVTWGFRINILGFRSTVVTGRPAKSALPLDGHMQSSDVIARIRIHRAMLGVTTSAGRLGFLISYRMVDLISCRMVDRFRRGTPRCFENRSESC